MSPTLSSEFDLFKPTTIIGSYSIRIYTPEVEVKVETKEEKIARRAHELMLASHKMYNQKDRYTIKVKRLCRPQHRTFQQKQFR